jgi:hypothetical protein
MMVQAITVHQNCAPAHRKSLSVKKCTCKLTALCTSKKEHLLNATNIEFASNGTQKEYLKSE